MASNSSTKRKRHVLSIDDKVAAVRMLTDGCSLTVVSEKFGIPKSTVSGLRKNREKMLDFQQKTAEIGMSRPAKRMKMGKSEELDDAVFMWFNQKRQQGIPVCGPLLCEKAKQLHEKMGKTDTFLATSG